MVSKRESIVNSDWPRRSHRSHGWNQRKQVREKRRVRSIRIARRLSSSFCAVCGLWARPRCVSLSLQNQKRSAFLFNDFFYFITNLYIYIYILEMNCWGFVLLEPWLERQCLVREGFMGFVRTTPFASPFASLHCLKKI